ENPKKEMGPTNAALRLPFPAFSPFKFVSDFDIRISDFLLRFTPHRLQQSCMSPDTRSTWPGRGMPVFRREMLPRSRLSHANAFWRSYGARPFGWAAFGPSTMSYNFRMPMYLPVLEPPMPQEYSVVMVFLKLVALDGGSRCPGG